MASISTIQSKRPRVGVYSNSTRFGEEALFVHGVGVRRGSADQLRSMFGSSRSRAWF
jgi:hypothetical protein